MKMPDTVDDPLRPEDTEYASARLDPNLCGLCSMRGATLPTVHVVFDTVIGKWNTREW
eukprot:gene26616-4239_t